MGAGASGAGAGERIRGQEGDRPERGRRSGPSGRRQNEAREFTGREECRRKARYRTLRRRAASAAIRYRLLGHLLIIGLAADNAGPAILFLGGQHGVESLGELGADTLGLVFLGFEGERALPLETGFGPA